MEKDQWEKIEKSITAQTRVVEVVEDIQKRVTALGISDAVLEERLGNHKEDTDRRLQTSKDETDRRFTSTHKRIDDVVSEARRQGAVAGAPVGVLAIVWASIKDTIMGGGSG